ncbi:sensor histidine kinase [Acidisarcina polymorpha]|uniref:histidine kinase n=1 Tax=Acidisarcina polymorpha TaxID=2211140 RepID=A0A2Z5FSS2_9BACT|nr:ATP-binding protein [Acidisarcina polymorpha]AXC09891.1 sensor histidine kinase [Acidisarcina polymorpha]
MATEDADLLAALESPDWTVALEAVARAESELRNSIVGDPLAELVIGILSRLASHPKWEVRRAVANAATHAPHATFEEALTKLARDDNQRVRQAAEHAALRRRDSRNASSLGKQHEERINATLDTIQSRFGMAGREAVKRAAEQMANTHARELYHEVIRLLTPLAASAERLRDALLEQPNLPVALAEEADGIGRRVHRIRTTLDAMRVYNQQPTLTFQSESLKEIVQEAANVAQESDRNESRGVSIAIHIPSSAVVEVSRTRLVQALTNILVNAAEAYPDDAAARPIEVTASAEERLIRMTIRDSGCGMSEENQRDALTLFSTSKATGTGFGLPLAVKIVESEHGGRLRLESAKGLGTSVNIWLPTYREVRR